MGIGGAHHTSQGAAALVAGIPAAKRDSDSDDEPMTARMFTPSQREMTAITY